MTREEQEKSFQNEGLVFHHVAVTSGYVRKDGIHVTKYEGRYGRGVLRHLPTVDLYFKTKRYHPVEYWLFPESIVEEYHG